ncbi:hypothetical protein TWF730_000580 [Orbilia blumenaviensis]|uniref:Uncharacterized protein n=1 Tax=Orbilia blumenaviensis TaxID=1796055 RepID=A0AAV9VQ36_9PEZI
MLRKGLLLAIICWILQLNTTSGLAVRPSDRGPSILERSVGDIYDRPSAENDGQGLGAKPVGSSRPPTSERGSGEYWLDSYAEPAKQRKRPKHGRNVVDPSVSSTSDIHVIRSGEWKEDVQLQRRTNYKIRAKSKKYTKGKEAAKDKSPKGVRKELKDTKKWKNGAEEDEIIAQLTQIDPDAAARLTKAADKEDYEWYSRYDDLSYLEYDYSGSEDEEIYESAIKRAYQRIVPANTENGDDVYDLPGVIVHRDKLASHHPDLHTLKAMQLNEKIFSPAWPTFIKLDLIGTQDDESISLKTWASSSQRHLVVDWPPWFDDETKRENLYRWMYLSWRCGSYPGKFPGDLVGDYQVDQVPSSPGAPLDYITIQNIADRKSMVILSQVAKLPGHRSTSYRDPNGKKTRNAYFFDSKILGQYHEDSPERTTVDAFLGSQVVGVVRTMLETFPDGLNKAAISSFILVIDYDANQPSATILIRLSLPESTSDPHSMGDFVLDTQSPGVDPRLIVVSQGSDLLDHPVDAEGSPFNTGPSYVDMFAKYQLELGGHVEFDFLYSTLENHIVLVNSEFVGEPDRDASAIKIGSILYSAWIREAGLRPISGITFLSISQETHDLVINELKIERSQGRNDEVIVLDLQNNPERLQALSIKLEQTESREREVLQALLGKSQEAFGPFRLIQMVFGVYSIRRPFLALTVEYSHDLLESDKAKWFGDPGNPVLGALRMGTRLKAEMEFLEPRFLEDEIGLIEEMKDPDPEAQLYHRNGDFAVLQTHKPIVFRYNFKPEKYTDCKIAKRPLLINEIVSWNEMLENSKGDPPGDLGQPENTLQSSWRRRIAVDFSGQESYCSFSLSLAAPEQQERAHDYNFAADFAISHEAGNVVLQQKLKAATSLRDFEDAIWSLWMAIDANTKLHPQDYINNVKGGAIGLRYVTILKPSDQTTHILRSIYSTFTLPTNRVIIFPYQDSAFHLLPDYSTTQDNNWRRILLTINGLSEVYAVENLCRRMFEEAYSFLNSRRRVNAVLVRWNENQPQLVIALGHFTFNSPRIFEGMMVSTFKGLASIRQRKDLKDVTIAGCEVAWSSVSSYMFELNNFTPDAQPTPQTVDTQGNPPWEYEISQEPRFILSCPLDVKNFLTSVPWKIDGETRKRIRPEEADDLRLLASEEASEDDKRTLGSWQGEMPPQVYREYTYKRRYHPSEYKFVVRGSPYHLLVHIGNDGQSGLSGISRATRIERLSRAYYDLFVRTNDLVRSATSESRWVSMRTHDISFETSSIIRNLWNMMSLAVPSWSGFDVSFMRGSDIEPTLTDIEEIEIGKTLLGLIEIGALGRMLSDHAIVMQNLKISRIIIQSAPDAEGVPDASFQILVLLRPQLFLARENY